MYMYVYIIHIVELSFVSSSICDSKEAEKRQNQYDQVCRNDSPYFLTSRASFSSSGKTAATLA